MATSPSGVIKMKKFTQRRALLFVLFIIVIIGIAAVWFARVDLYAMLSALGEFGYPGVFLMSFIGAVSIIIPIPTPFILFTISGAGIFDPTLLALAFGLGAAVGELSGYGLGYFGRKVVGRKYDRRLNAMVRIFDRFGVLAVFIFALTPLPDDLLFIPLGLMRYSLWKALAAAVAGKFVMSLIIIHVGMLVGRTFVVNWVLAVAMMILLMVLMVAMFRVEWEKLVEKYFPSRRKRA